MIALIDRLKYRSILYRKLGWRYLSIYLNDVKKSQTSPKRIITTSSKDIPYPIYYRTLTTDIRPLTQVFVHKMYGCIDFITDAQRILDCGANVGYASVFMAIQHPNAQIISIEPDQDNFMLLQQNIKPFGSRITPIQAGIWSRSTNLKIDSNSSDSDSFTVSECKANETPDVVALDINSILHEAGWDNIDILKIDIEGSEKVVFGENFEQWLPKVRCIVVELHDEECMRIFDKAVSNRVLRRFNHDELTICIMK